MPGVRGPKQIACHAWQGDEQKQSMKTANLEPFTGFLGVFAGDDVAILSLQTDAQTQCALPMASVTALSSPAGNDRDSLYRF